mgnify:CR=1 FL=1
MPFCAKCGTKLSDDASFCSKCGTATHREVVDLGSVITNAMKTAGRELEAALKTAGEEIERAFAELRDEFSERKGLFCIRCGKRNPQGARFCFACGREIPKAA